MATTYTARETAELLGIAPRSLTRLSLTNVIPNSRVGRQTLYDAEAVDNLRNRPKPPEGAGGALVVRLAEPKEDPAYQRMTGWNEQWEQEVKEEAARKFWQVPDPDELIDYALVAAVAGWTVAVWRISGYTAYPGGICAFSIEPPTPKMLDEWSEKHLDIPRGPVRFIFPGASYNDHPEA